MQYRKGQQYQIDYITKVRKNGAWTILFKFVPFFQIQGATLQFECQSHPSLPPSLSKRRLLYIKVTCVDEAMKRQLLYAQ